MTEWLIFVAAVWFSLMQLVQVDDEIKYEISRSTFLVVGKRLHRPIQFPPLRDF
jgi:hypothetical protein